MKTFSRKTNDSRHSMSYEKRREILNQLFFEREERKPYEIQFYSLLSLSAVIATIGLLTDSSAVVIGAMLLSPLMTPILAFAASLVMGWPARAGRVAVRLFLATLFVFVLAYLMPFVFRFPVNVVIPDEIMQRTNPTMGELLVGLCAGIAAAYILVRKEAASALPGVAIAVAVVPPLCAAGLLTYSKQYTLAWEAFFLYTTNLVAIILTAGAVLLVTGFKPRVRDLKFNLRVAGGMTLATCFVAMVAIPLSIRTFGDIRDLHDRQAAISVVTDWIGENSVKIANVEVEDDVFQVFLKVNMPIEALYENQPMPLKPRLSPEMTIDALKQRLAAELDKEVDIILKGSFSFWQSTRAVPGD